jgi:N-acetylneuraminic acid mutarotase
MNRPIFKITLILSVVSFLILASAKQGSTTPLPPSTGTWATKAAMPTARAEAVSGVINGLLYVVGGEDGINSLSVLEVYDPTTNTWATKAPMPTARTGAAAGVIDGKLYVVGGSDLPETQKFNTLEVYDPATDTWATKAPMPTARNVPGFGVINGKLYVVGGAPRTTILEVYNPATDTWETKAPMFTARAYPAAAVINGKLYVAGGSTPTVLTGALEVYEPITDTWTSKAPMPTPRYVLEAAALNAQLYTIGGDPSNSGFPSESAINEVYDPATDTWNNEAPLPTARWGMTGGVISGTIYVVGGAIGLANGDNGTPQTISEAFTNGDTTPPVISNASANPSVLWPPNHKMRDVVINYDATDDSGSVDCALTVSSNEGTSADWEIIDAHHVRLRAERAGNGSGRVYTITIICTDRSDNSSSQALTVTVPRDQR